MPVLGKVPETVLLHLRSQGPVSHSCDSELWRLKNHPRIGDSDLLGV